MQQFSTPALILKAQSQDLFIQQVCLLMRKRMNIRLFSLLIILLSLSTVQLLAQAGNAISLSVSANSGSEVNTTSITVTATANAAVTGNQTVTLAVTGAGITTGDYYLTNATITILSGQTTGTLLL